MQCKENYYITLNFNNLSVNKIQKYYSNLQIKKITLKYLLLYVCHLIKLSLFKLKKIKKIHLSI